MAIITFPFISDNQAPSVKGKYVTEASTLGWQAEYWPNHVVLFHNDNYILMKKLSPIDGRPDLGYIYRGLDHLGITIYLDVVND